MTDAELDAIEARAKEAETALVNGPEATALFDSVADVPELVAEVRRLRKRVQAANWMLTGRTDVP